MKFNAAFKRWFGKSVIAYDNGEPLVVYHGTDKQFSKFNTKKSTQGIIWFTSDRSKIERGEVGASGHGRIVEMYVRMERPAGWKEYDKLLLAQLRQDYDGAILPDGDGGFDGFVFDPRQIKIVGGV